MGACMKTNRVPETYLLAFPFFSPVRYAKPAPDSPSPTEAPPALTGMRPDRSHYGQCSGSRLAVITVASVHEGYLVCDTTKFRES